MEKLDRHIKIAFSSYAQGSMALQRVVLEALQYDVNDRPSAQEMYDKVMNIRQGIKLHEQPTHETACGVAKLVRGARTLICRLLAKRRERF